MDPWSKRLLLLTCVLCCSCRVQGFNVSSSDLENAWQSSQISERGCFRESSDRPGEWDYFISSSTPDSSGHQWLLLKLVRPVRVRSVTVYGRLSAHRRVRAEGIEVLIGDRMPAGLTEASYGCVATFDHRLAGFRLCGSTSRTERAGGEYEVSCAHLDDSKMTQFLLLRKYVRYQRDMCMNFRLLEVLEFVGEFQFCVLLRHFDTERSGCSVSRLSQLKPNEKVVIRASKPCDSASGSSACSIRMLNGNVLALSAIENSRRFLVFEEFNVSLEMHEATLQCRYFCSKGAVRSPPETIRIRVNPKSYKIEFRDAKFWTVGRTAEFTFSTEGSFPPPEHRCSLLNASEDLSHRLGYPQNGSLAPKSSRKKKENSTFNLETRFEIGLDSSHEGGEVFCGYRMPGGKNLTFTRKRLPKLLKPCKTQLRLSASSSWVDGEVVNVTLDSSEDNWVDTSHRCFLQTGDGRNETLRLISSSNSSSTFSVSVSRQWGSSASLLCLVNQSGLIETWAALPTALFGAPNIRLLSERIRSGSAVEVSLLSSGRGDPSAQHRCRLAGRELRQLQAPSESTASSRWTFDALATDNEQRVRCDLVQTISSGFTAFTQSVSSEKLSVLYRSANSWNATRPLVMKEGESVSVSVRSVGGNPESSHRCWLQTADGRRTSMDLQADGGRQERESVVALSILISPARELNGGSVVCRVSQGNETEFASDFEQRITVFFASNDIGWSGRLLNGSELRLTGQTQEGNPRPELHCSLRSDTVSVSGLNLIEEPDIHGKSSGWIRRVRLSHSLTQPQAEVTVTCTISQSWPGLGTLFKPVESSRIFRAEFEEQQGAPEATSSPRTLTTAVTVAALGCSLAAAVAVCAAVAAAVLSRRRAAASYGVTVEMLSRRADVKPVDPNTVYYEG